MSIGEALKKIRVLNMSKRSINLNSPEGLDKLKVINQEIFALTEFVEEMQRHGLEELPKKG
jgi:hypothetical protein